MNYDEFNNIIAGNTLNIYFDTNSLLNLYKKPLEVIESYIDNITSLTNQTSLRHGIRIPRTVEKEFDKNIYTKKREVAKSINNNFNELEKELNKTLTKVKNIKNDLLVNGEEFDQNEYIRTINSLEAQRSWIESQNNNFKIRENKDKDRVLTPFFRQVFSQNNLLSKISRVDQIQYMNDGYTRMKHNFPPAFRDRKKYYDAKKTAAKQNNRELSYEDLISYLGDYFIWAEIIKDSCDSTRDAIFVTADMKSDWWCMPEDNDTLEEYLPRIELKEEFNELTGQHIEFIPLDLFIQFLESYFGNQLVSSLFMQYWSEYSDKLENKILESVENEEIAYTSIIHDSEVTRGYVAYDWSITPGEANITTSSVINVEDIDENTKRLIVRSSFSCLGDFEVSSGIEGDIYHSSYGTFKLDSGKLDSIIEVDKEQLIYFENNNGFEEYKPEIEDFSIYEEGNIELDVHDYDRDEKYFNHYYQDRWERE